MKTIIAAFSDRAAAERGEELLQARIAGHDDAEKFKTSLLDEGDGSRDVIERLSSRRVPKDRAQVYAEMLRRGASVLVADVPDKEADDLADELDGIGALDLEAAEKRFRASGWTGYQDPEHAEPYDEGRVTGERAAFDQESGHGKDLDVIEEQVQIGKRQVSRGGVRVRTYVAERPVEEEVTLHEERIDVQREAVNEAISPTSADAAFTEDEFVVTAQGEEAVVGKEARVVERVHVGKRAEDRTETVRETERRKDVEVENIDQPQSTNPPRR